MFKPKILLVILDGLGDHVIKELRGRTPLEAAHKPNLDKLAREGENGMIYTVKQGVRPGSDTAHLSLFGYDPWKYYLGRGVYEALGAGIELIEGDVAFRVNIATVENGIVVDRRAGRNDYGVEELFSELDGEEINGVKIILKHTVEHRGVLVLRGKDLSKNVTSNDPHRIGEKVEEIKPLSDDAKFTAEVLRELTKKFEEIAKNHPINQEREKEGIPKANYLLIRGPGQFKPIDITFEEKFNLKPAFIAGAALYKGVAKYVGMNIIKVPGATGTVNTSLFAKAEAAIRERDKHDIVIVHIKATDSLAHDRNPIGKKKFIERVDKYFFSRVKDEFDIIAVTGDHTTSSIFGDHTADPVPILIYSTLGQRKDPIKKFQERKSFRGILGYINGISLMNILLDKANLLPKYGA